MAELIRRTCQNRKCNGHFYDWTQEPIKFCPYCGKKLGPRDKEKTAKRVMGKCKIWHDDVFETIASCDINRTRNLIQQIEGWYCRVGRNIRVKIVEIKK